MSSLRGGCSKAQACLKKILHIISTIQPPSTRGFDIDLNQSLSESAELESLDRLSACSFVGKEIESDLSEERRDHENEKPIIINGEEMEEKTNEGSSSDITDLLETELKDVMIKEEEDEDDGVQTGPFRGKEERSGVSSRSRNNESNDCFALLIAAAELISSNESECPSRDKEVSLSQSTHDHHEKKTVMINESTSRINKWTVDLDDTSPVVRSKRGRSQVLPYRFRDSVLLLEPCKRRPKRSSTSTVVSTKRQSR